MRATTLLVAATAWLATACSGTDVTTTLACVDFVQDRHFAGGPGRDAIPALDMPLFVEAADAGFLRE